MTLVTGRCRDRDPYLVVGILLMMLLSACSGTDGPPERELAGAWITVEEGDQGRFVFTDTTVSLEHPQGEAVRPMELSTRESGLFSVYLPGIDRHSYVEIVDDSTAVWVSRKDYGPMENPEAAIAGAERPGITRLILRRADGGSSP